MANELELTIACGAYDRTLGLFDGRVQIPGIRLRHLDLPVPDIFLEMIQFQEYDVAEMSLSAHIMGVSTDDWPFVGIPVFPSRMFRHSDIWVKDGGHIAKPEDLRGATIGVPEYHMTANLFIRGMLSDDYGIKAEDINWVQGGQTVAGRKERVELNLPVNISLVVEHERTLEEMLLTGDIDALSSPLIPKSHLQGRTEFRRLFDSPRQTEIDYFRRTGIFPIMHMVVVRQDIHDAHPWVVKRLMNAFVEAKRVCFERISGYGMLPAVLPTFQHDYEETIRVFGKDFWPYGVASNRAVLGAAARYSHEQGLSKRLVEVEELFAPTTLWSTVV